MSLNYKINDQQELYYLTYATVVPHSSIGRVDVFTRRRYAEIVIDSLSHCVENKGLIIYSWVIMSNHVHLIARSEKEPLSDILRDHKKFVSGNIITSIKDHPESRRNWMLCQSEFIEDFSSAGKKNRNNTNYQFWQQENHPIVLYSNEVMQQKLDYIHNNPVRAGLVDEPWHYRYSSARDYIGQEGLLKVRLLE